MENTIKITHSLRANKQYSKAYIDNLLAKFTPLYVAKVKADRGSEYTVTSVDYGKQDIRGTESICFFDDRYCVPHQNHFASSKELIAYVQGFLDAQTK